jgi:Fe-S-cluster containining protein
LSLDVTFPLCHDASMPTSPESAALLQATIAQIAPWVPQVDNLGRSGNWLDLYYLLDYLCFAVDRAYPEIPCSKGCSHCCHNQLFRVTQVEWEVVREGLLALPDEKRKQVMENAWRMYASHYEALEGMAEAWSDGDNISKELHVGTPKTCPFLLENRCSIYEHRPAICRGYGYSSATIGPKVSLLICQQEGPAWIRHLEAKGIEQFPMPSWNPIQRQLERLNGDEPIKPMPLWLLEEAEHLEA